ncbi:hypothetical protein I302_107348 [Kwoniella bestiolae CBS 10118]|uniref:NADH dehydrogenase [ubiquinone] 1 alpha subcomplex subunit n=1 Tax=Kwoniella bestiolae CBS 10118 TaxID=1296100 RepID=A0A1B9FYT9_9TREE|nr:hypothetical protein I302_06915 [Kwoniella bestiolae CBS 10118]OCF23929.1 hypothetical protein I302_06915 [Kwoniella bestiolae CBS 10118]
MSGIFGAVKKFFRPKGLIGYDLQGNKYFEIPNPAGGRMKRFVQYKKNRDLAEYSRAELRPPVQWRAWLSHTRVEPPTLQELQTDTNRQTNLQPKIAAIEAREREERIRQGYLLPDGSVPQAPSQIAGPSTPSERAARLKQIGQPQHVNPLNSEEIRSGSYDVPTPTQRGIAEPSSTVDPARHSSAEDLRRLAMEDTRRRIAESTQQQQQQQIPQGRKGEPGVEGVGLGLASEGLKPRRRGGA